MSPQSKWIADPLTEMYSVCFKLLQENAGLVKICMNEKDSLGNEKHLDITVCANLFEEGDDESAPKSDENIRPELIDF